MSDALGVTAVVRKMAFSDLELVLSWRNHPVVRRQMYTQNEISWAEHVSWFEKMQVDPSRHLLVYEHDGSASGVTTFSQTSGLNATWGFYVAPGAPRGTGSSMGAAALDYAFAVAALHKISGEALAQNEKSQRFHLKMGFTQEGVLREHFFDGSQYHDVICFGLLRDEWLTSNKQSRHSIP